jgi:hypothetical protein
MIEQANSHLKGLTNKPISCVLLNLAGCKVILIAFADLDITVTGRPAGVAFLVADHFHSFDLNIADRAHDVAFTGATVRSFGGETFYFSHCFLLL